MKFQPDNMKILVVDIGGTHVKCKVTGSEHSREFASGRTMTASDITHRVLRLIEGWQFDVVSLGYPGVVRNDAPAQEPHNLAPGWVGFNFQKEFGCPVKIINDAAMQALGAYQGGTMLFLGLGTGLGSTLIVEGIVVPMELGHLSCPHGPDFEHFVGQQGLVRLGEERWRRGVIEVIEGFRRALLPDYIVLGGGNVHRLPHLPPHTRRGDNADAFAGGIRLWRQGSDASRDEAA